MRLKATFMGTMEMVGNITSLKVKDDWLVMNLSTIAPMGWNMSAALTHEDLMTLLRLMLKPRNLRYVLFGSGKPRDQNRMPEY